MTMAAPYALRFQIGARTLFTMRRTLRRQSFSLADVLGRKAPRLPPLDAGDDGYVITSLPVTLLPAIEAQARGMRIFERQRYVRHFADLDQDFDAYLAGFSAKSRATLQRKRRKFAEAAGGEIEVRLYRTIMEFEIFFALARGLSKRTYQEKLLDAGLPSREEERAAMSALARQGKVRAFLLFLGGKAAAYLYLQADGDTLIYAYLGFDPAKAALSPGAVLQMEAMRMLMEEGAFRRLDFTEGEGQHKRLFATGGVECVGLLVLRPSIGNGLRLAALDRFDRVVAAGKAWLGHPSLQPLTRAIRR